MRLASQTITCPTEGEEMTGQDPNRKREAPRAFGGILFLFSPWERAAQQARPPAYGLRSCFLRRKHHERRKKKNDFQTVDGHAFRDDIEKRDFS